MGLLYFGDDYVTLIKKRRIYKPRRNKQSILPKKPKQEPLTKIIKGNHPIIFKTANGKTTKEITRNGNS